MILLDTTVLAYAVGTEHPLKGAARWLLEAHQAGTITATTTVEVLQEFLHIRARRHARDEAASVTLRFVEVFDLLVASSEELSVGAGLFVRNPRLGAFDCVLAAVAIQRNVEALISADHAYEGVQGLRWVDLAAADLASQLVTR